MNTVIDVTQVPLYEVLLPSIQRQGVTWQIGWQEGLALGGVVHAGNLATSQSLGQPFICNLRASNPCNDKSWAIMWSNVFQLFNSAKAQYHAGPNSNSAIISDGQQNYAPF